MKKVIAIFLIFTLVTQGNGITYKIITCCDVISGIAFGSKNNTENAQTCIKTNNEACCVEYAYNTSINSVLSVTRNVQQFDCNFCFVKTPIISVINTLSQTDFFPNYYISEISSPPILLKKRVLQI